MWTASPTDSRWNRCNNCKARKAVHVFHDQIVLAGDAILARHQIADDVGMVEQRAALALR